jgi:hypothetical protein
MKSTNQLLPLLFQPPAARTPDGIPILIVTSSMEATVTQQTKPIKWLDERLYCKHARQEDIDGAATCLERQQNAQGAIYCGLTGLARCLPCAFDEPENSDLWQRIRASVAKYQEEGWTPSPRSEAKRAEEGRDPQ